MAECWSCGAERGEAAFCTTCAKLQPVSRRQSFFDALSQPRRLGLDEEALERAFRDLSRRFHPDRFGNTSPIERRLALEHTARINEGYRTLKDRQRRAEYLMSLEGVDVASEEARTSDPGLLMEMLELQEEVDAAQGAEVLEAHQRSVKARRGARLTELASYFDERRGRPEEAVAALTELRYLRRLAERIDAKLEEMS